jgi:hypothetical protein
MNEGGRAVPNYESAPPLGNLFANFEKKDECT